MKKLLLLLLVALNVHALDSDYANAKAVQRHPSDNTASTQLTNTLINTGNSTLINNNAPTEFYTLAPEQELTIDYQQPSGFIWNAPNVEYRAVTLFTVYHAPDPQRNTPTNFSVQDHPQVATVNAGYQYGRFIAQTGIWAEVTEDYAVNSFYLQGSFMVVNNEHLTISVTARINTAELTVADYHDIKHDKNLFTQDGSSLGNLNSTLGILGTYLVNKQWAVIGAMTSTSLANEAFVTPLPEHNIQHMALIGTTYAF